jgi:hypothetical protein
MTRKLFLIALVLMSLMPTQIFNGASQQFDNTHKVLTNPDSFNSDIVMMLGEINESILSYYLERFVSFGYKFTGSSNCRKAAEWIKQEFEDMGLHTYFDDWRFTRHKDRNVIAVHNGTDEKSDAVIVVSAHYDTIGDSPGANDDGSGIAAMLAIANVTSNHGFNHSVRFVGLSGEEVGTYGSFADAEKSYNSGENIIAVLNIDSIGYVGNPEDINIIQIFSQDRSEWIADLAEKTSKKYESFFKLNVQHSMHYPADQESYNDWGYDAAQFVQPHPETCHWFHTPDDTTDKINYTYLTKVTKLMLTILYDLAITPILVQLQITSPKEARVYLRDFPLIRLPAYNLVFTKIRAITYILGSTKVKINVTTTQKINSVYFGIDGYVRHICNEPPYEYRIGKGFYASFRLKGIHKLTVCVTTNTGMAAYDEMDIYVVKLI